MRYAINLKGAGLVVVFPSVMITCVPVLVYDISRHIVVPWCTSTKFGTKPASLAVLAHTC